jgi:hypothetical protein
MSEEDLLYSYFCDESCHLENDGMPVMGLGALWLPTARVRQASEELRAIKTEHGIRQNFEAKWTQVSPAQVGFYEALLNYFFDHDEIRFRGVIARDKASVQYADDRGGHDGWYYRMYWLLLRGIIAPPRHARIYLDIKDTRGGPKVTKLHDILANTHYDFDHEYLERIQIVRSHEVELLQLTDLLIGALTAQARGTTTSPAKQALIKLIETRIRRKLGFSTSPDALDFNVFYWSPRVTK